MKKHLINLFVSLATAIVIFLKLPFLSFIPLLSAVVSLVFIIRGLLARATKTSFKEIDDNRVQFTSMLIKAEFSWNDVEKISISKRQLMARIILKEGANVQTGSSFQKSEKISHQKWFVINLGAIDLGLNEHEFLGLFDRVQEKIIYEG